MKKQYSLRSLPSVKRLQELEELSGKRNLLYEERSMIRKELKDLENAKFNLQHMLTKEKTQELWR